MHAIPRARRPRWFPAASIGLLIGLASMAFLAALPGPSPERIAAIQERLKIAMVDIENYGIVRRFEKLPPDPAVIRSLRDDLRQRASAHLVEPLRSQWIARTAPYIDSLATGSTRTVATGATWTDWAFERSELTADHATITGTATHCNPFIDYSFDPPVRGNPCGRLWFRATLVLVNDVWMLSGLETERVGGSG